MEIDTGTDTSFPEGEDNTQSSAAEQENDTRNDEETGISLELQQQEQQGGEAALDNSENTSEQREIDGMSGVMDSEPTAVQELERSASVHKPRRYARWFQALAVLVVICLIGGVVLAVRSWQSPNGQVHVTPRLPAPITPLSVTRWCVATGASVDPRAGRVTLTKVVALSSDDAWILGSTSTGNNFNGNSGRAFPLLEHWNGKAWNIVPTADTTTLVKQQVHKIGGGQVSESVSLSDLAVLSDRNIWAVGDISVQKIGTAPASTAPPTLAMFQSTGQPLVEHWDGNVWQIVAIPPIMSDLSTLSVSLDRYRSTLSSISAIAANNIWAVGTQPVLTPYIISVPLPGSFVTPVTISGPLVEHWDGTHWKIVHLPASLQHESLLTIQAISASDVWAFGVEQDFWLPGPPILKPYNPPPASNHVVVTGVLQTVTSHLVHWNGQAWSTMSLPSSLGKKGYLLDVAAITDTNIWAIGESNISGSTQSGLDAIEHWDGQAWTTLADWPQMRTKGTRLEQITVLGPNNVWITGSNSKNQPLMAHWNGKAWNLVIPTSPVYGSTKNLAVAGQRAWALVDEQESPAAQKISIPGVSPETIGEVIETSC
jgi:hypothetical protein